jgi:hypothetical protein
MADRLNQTQGQPKHQFRQRLMLVLGILAFVALFQWGYINWLSQVFGYFGFDYYSPPAKYVVLAWIFSASPSLWMPLTITRPSQLAYWVLYLTVFIPSMFIPLFVKLNAPLDIAKLMLTLFVGFAVSGVGYLLPLYAFRGASVRRSAYWSGFTLLTVVCTVWVLIMFRNNIHLVSFGDVYELRESASDLEAGTLLNYPLMWLYGAINPFMIATGLFHKRIWLLLAGVLGQILVYSSMGTKASVLSIVFIFGIYFLLRKGRFPFAVKFTWGIVALFAVLCLLHVLWADEPGLLLSLMMFLVFFRSFGLAGLETGQYYYFFQHNPHTYYSHIKGISWLIHYPFHNPLGTELGYYYYYPLNDLTSHFWATDGIAALGLPGILLISVVFAVLFRLVDSLAQRHDPRYAALVIFYATYNLANLSMFTTLLSGGLGLLMLLLYLTPPQTAQSASETVDMVGRRAHAGSRRGPVPLPG